MPISQRIYPVCDRPVGPGKGVYRIGAIDCPRECHEKRSAGQATGHRE